MGKETVSESWNSSPFRRGSTACSRLRLHIKDVKAMVENKKQSRINQFTNVLISKCFTF